MSPDQEKWTLEVLADFRRKGLGLPDFFEHMQQFKQVISEADVMMLIDRVVNTPALPAATTPAMHLPSAQLQLQPQKQTQPQPATAPTVVLDPPQPVKRSTAPGKPRTPQSTPSRPQATAPQIDFLPFPTDRNLTLEEIRTKASEIAYLAERAGVACTLKADPVDCPRMVEIQLHPSNVDADVEPLLSPRFKNNLVWKAKLPSSTMIVLQPGYIAVQVPKRFWEAVYFFEHFTPKKVQPKPDAPLIAGVGLDNYLQWVTEEILGVCVGGGFRSGKSTWLKTISLYLMGTRHPKDFKQLFVDPKPAGFAAFNGSPYQMRQSNWLIDIDEVARMNSFGVPQCIRDGTPITEGEEFEALLQLCIAEGKKRQELFIAHGFNNAIDYNRNHPRSSVPLILFAVDELGMIMGDKGSKERKKRDALLSKAVKVLRSAGWSWEIADQRPSNKVLPTDVDANLYIRVAMKVADDADSKIILGGNRTEAALLLGYGDGIIRDGAKSSRFQGLNVDDKEIENFVQWTIAQYGFAA